MRVLNVSARIDAVIHWLERMKTSYTSGHAECAYLDAECARADLEVLRREAFCSIRPRRTHIAANIIRSVFLCAVFLLSIASPVSMPQPSAPVPASEVHSQTHTAPAPVVRADSPATVPQKSRKTSRRTIAKKQSQKNARIQPAEKVSSTATTQKSPAHDKIFSLVRTGRRALDNDKSVIFIK